LTESLPNFDQFSKKMKIRRRITGINRTAKRLTAQRLHPPSTATAPQVVAIPVRSFGRLRVRPVAHTQSLSDGIFWTKQTGGCLDMRAFLLLLERGRAKSQSLARAENGGGDGTAYLSRYRPLFRFAQFHKVFSPTR
jgi:hypothetical protein